MEIGSYTAEMPTTQQQHHRSFNSVPDIIRQEITLRIIITGHTLKPRSTITELIIIRLNHRVQFSDMVEIAAVSDKM